MTNFEDPIRLVREFKGAAISILVLLSHTPVPVSKKWLAVHSGYSDKPVADALQYLCEHGFVIKSTGGWILSQGARQLPLPLDPSLDHPAAVDSQPPEPRTAAKSFDFEAISCNLYSSTEM